MSTELTVNDKLNGFTVTGIRDIKEIEGTLIEMTHDRTGAGLVWTKCAEENKLFSVGFRTLPSDNTGVFHILEHSVLCGSEKYPVKEPFVELLKTSMNTFLNAMTFSDKTLYPVSSRMEQDYLNLMHVYLDAVFCPKILENPNIFYQEGWHIETGDGEPHYNGVVFNEMKGAMSDVDQIVERGLLKLLFPDTCYGYNSGGDPDAIPDLTYDDFIDRYKTFYHPSNAYFYLDGDIPLEKTLSVIDSYLSKYDRLEEVPQITMQEPKTTEAVIEYEVSDEDGKAVVTIGRIAGTWEDRDKLLTLSVLTEQLADSNESPLKRAVLSSGLAGDMELYISDCIAQPYIMFIFRDVDPSALGDEAAGLSTEDAVRLACDRLIGIISSTVSGLVRDGIPEKGMLASANQLDFRFRQYPEPQGLYRANSVFNAWLYGGDPALYLRTDEAIARLRANITDGTAGKLAEEYFTDENAWTRLLVLPSATLGDRLRAKEKERVTAIVDAMTTEELDELERMDRGLKTWQETADSAEALSTIPKLELSDIRRTPELIGTDVKVIDGVTVLSHPLPTKGIVYLNLFMPVTGLSIEELPAAALITEFYKDLPTENYSVTDLQDEIKMWTGSVSFGIDILSSDTDMSVCTPCIRARASVLEENLSHAEDLIIEILTRTRFEDSALMAELIAQIDEECKRYAISSGHRLAILAARSHYSARDAAAEAINGFTFTQYMHSMREGGDEAIRSFTDFARKVIAENVVRADAAVTVTSGHEADVSRLISMLPEGTARPASAAYSTALPEKMGIRVPASVSHSVAAYDLSGMGIRPAGSISVASNIVSFAYLWNQVRVSIGAYGTSLNASRTGSIFCYSYRDPKPDMSLAVFRTIPEFLETFVSSDSLDLQGFIISTVASTEPLVSVAAKGRNADDFWFSGFTDDDRIRIRREILDTTVSDLLSWKEAFERLASDASVCVIGPETALEKVEGLEIMDI